MKYALSGYENINLGGTAGFKLLSHETENVSRTGVFYSIEKPFRLSYRIKALRVPESNEPGRLQDDATCKRKENAIMANSKEIPYKIYLEESEMPKQWYNLRADMKNKPAPLLNPATLQPITFEELRTIFCDELARQELNDTDAYIDIPKEIRDFYKMYRPSPLVRAYCLEEKLQTPAKIYYKFEGNAPEYISRELKECAKMVSELDDKMLSLNEAILKCLEQAEEESRQLELLTDRDGNPILNE